MEADSRNAGATAPAKAETKADDAPAKTEEPSAPDVGSASVGDAPPTQDEADPWVRGVAAGGKKGRGKSKAADFSSAMNDVIASQEEQPEVRVGTGVSDDQRPRVPYGLVV